MRSKYIILFFSLILGCYLSSSAEARTIRFNFYGDTIHMNWDPALEDDEDTQMTEANIIRTADKLGASNYQPLIARMLAYKEQNHLDDWFYYQLIRKTAEQISPKAKNYDRYTVVKWFLLSRSHYDATLAFSNNILLFYVRSNDNIYDIPSYKKEDGQYVCLNYHDYGSKIDFTEHAFHEIYIPVPEATTAFSYRVTRMPDFKTSDYAEKDIKFKYRRRNYDFKVKVNPELKNIFVNYPVVDYDAYFNIPISKSTYNSFVPELKKAVKGMTQKKGVDYLMRFTRYSFAYESDQQAFGKEKRFSPEQTLLSEYSDCDDRAALFFYLVREIYNVPMIVLLYPEHVTIAVKFDKTGNKGILYNNVRYEVCEPTPQAENLKIGAISSHLKHTPYQVAYAYHP